MDCERAQRDGCGEKYIQGALTLADQEAFEKHVLECPRCREECELHLALKAACDKGFAKATARRAHWKVWWQRVAAAACAAVVTLAGIALWTRSAPLPAPSVTPFAPEPGPTTSAAPPTPASTARVADRLAELADVDPPKYTPIVLRGVESEARTRFREAMKAYLAGDYATAATGLEQAAKLDAKAPQVRFFLGVCRLCEQRHEAAIAEFQRTIAQGPTPFLEEAHLYLGVAYLRAGDADAAREELTSVVRLDGELAGEARILISELERVHIPPQ